MNELWMIPGLAVGAFLLIIFGLKTKLHTFIALIFAFIGNQPIGLLSEI